jgi:hypothetical protein
MQWLKKKENENPGKCPARLVVFDEKQKQTPNLLYRDCGNGILAGALDGKPTRKPWQRQGSEMYPFFCLSRPNI